MVLQFEITLLTLCRDRYCVCKAYYYFTCITIEYYDNECADPKVFQMDRYYPEMGLRRWTNVRLSPYFLVMNLTSRSMDAQSQACLQLLKPHRRDVILRENALKLVKEWIVPFYEMAHRDPTGDNVVDLESNI